MEFSADYIESLVGELLFSASRSSGPGGQNVNKVNSRIELRFNIFSSKVLSDFQKDRLLKIAGKKVNSEGTLILFAQDDRSQLKNKQIAIERFIELVKHASIPLKTRKRTKPGAAAKENRLQGKKIKSRIKASRRLNPFANE